MSMLTPPGMGGKYRVTGNTFPRMRRPSNRRRIVLSAVAGAVVLGVIGWGSVQLFGVFNGNGSGHNAAADHCPTGGEIGTKAGESGGAGGSGSTTTAPVPNPSAVTVNVYNATDRDGLAAHTADALKQRGFKIGKIGNAPTSYENKVTGTALLLGGPQAQAALKVLGTQLAAGTLKTDPARGTADVDLIIGKQFAALDPTTNANHALAVLRQPLPTSSDKGCPTHKAA